MESHIKGRSFYEYPCDWEWAFDEKINRFQKKKGNTVM